MIQYTDTVQVRDRLFRDSVSSCCSLAFMILSVSVGFFMARNERRFQQPISYHKRIILRFLQVYCFLRGPGWWYDGPPQGYHRHLQSRTFDDRDICLGEDTCTRLWSILSPLLSNFTLPVNPRPLELLRDSSMQDLIWFQALIILPWGLSINHLLYSY